ncbi:polysaccharide export protein [bacterium]|nr:polysaccharide export protein [bacterium]
MQKKLQLVQGTCAIAIFLVTVSCAQNQVRFVGKKTASLPVQVQTEAIDNKTQPGQSADRTSVMSATEYTLGVDDVIQIDVLKPEPLTTFSTVAPDGKITFPYIGNVLVKGRTVAQVQEEIQARLADGYMKYPVVAVALKESRSRNFFVYGEVLKPGSYPIEENMTVLRAISMAGGFSRFGSSSRVKVLRPKKNGPGYDTLKINVNAVMKGNASEDLLLSPGDIVVISEGMF